MDKRGNVYFRSKVFIRLFLSYVLIIAVFLTLYTGIYVAAYSSYYEDMVSREMQQKATAWGMMMDQQLFLPKVYARRSIHRKTAAACCKRCMWKEKPLIPCSCIECWVS